MTIFAEIETLLAGGESDQLEFKTSFDRETIETLVAFANAHGGTVLIGVADDGTIRGVTLGKEGLTIEDLKTDNYQSHLRNKLIAEAFYLTRNIEKYGSGFLRIRKELESYPEVSFAIEEVGGGVLVTFRLREGVGEGVGEGIGEGVNRLYQCIKQTPGVRLPELSNRLQVPVKTLERWIKQLRDEKKVVFKGSPKTGGYFAVEESRET